MIGLSPELDAQVDAAIDDAFRAFETAERNRKALDEWRYLRARRSTFTDALRSPVERLLVNRWFAQRREVATAWLNRSLFFRRQAG